MVKKILKLNLDDFVIAAAVVGGAFLLMELVITIIMAAVKPDTVPTLGGVLLPCAAFMMCLFFNVFQIPVGFDQILRFGITRRSTLLGILSLMTGETVFAFAMAGVLSLADKLIANIWVATQPELTIEEFAVPLWGYAALGGVSILLGLICGAVIQFFGRKAMYVLWFGFMGFMTVMNATGWEGIENLDRLPPVGIAAAVILVLAACAWSVWTLMRASVRN